MANPCLEPQLPRRRFLRILGGSFATETGITILGGSLGGAGLTYYAMQMAAKQNLSDPPVRSETLRITVREVWLPQSLIQVAAELRPDSPVLASAESLMTHLGRKKLQDAWFMIVLDVSVEDPDGEYVDRQLLVCSPGRNSLHADFLALAIRAESSDDHFVSPMMFDWSGFNKFDAIPAEWVDKPPGFVVSEFSKAGFRFRDGDGLFTGRRYPRHRALDREDLSISVDHDPPDR